MWKDSAIDLVAMAKSKEESTEKVDSSLLVNEGGTNRVSLGVLNDSNPDLVALARPYSSTESVRAKGSLRSLPASDPSSSGMPKEEQDLEELMDGRYSGFNLEYGYYDMEYPYAAPTVVGAKQSGDNFCCCLLACWFGKNEHDRLQESYEEEAIDSFNGEEIVAEQTRQKKDFRDDENTATGNEMYDEQLTDQDQLAVRARLRVSETDPGHVDSPFNAPPMQQTGLEFEPDSVETTPAKDDDTTKSGTSKVKGILKASSTVPAPAVPCPRSIVSGTTGRRSLFATTYEKKPHSRKHVCFYPIARVITVKSCNDMSLAEKTSIWWQKPDYDSFKEAERLNAKPLVEGGSEIWLTNTSPSSATKSLQLQHSKSDCVRQNHHLLDRSELRQEAGEESSSDEFSSKWWCRRTQRGLEHIVSVDEGRQRQNNVRLAVRAVLEEQRRQKLYGMNDPERIRNVELKHASWARDLALASGAADAECVRSSFSGSAKRRSFYLQKQASTCAGSARQVSAFMDPSISKVPNSLDANAVSQIQFQVTVSPRAEEKKSEDNGKLDTVASGAWQEVVAFLSVLFKY